MIDYLSSPFSIYSAKAPLSQGELSAKQTEGIEKAPCHVAPCNHTILDSNGNAVVYYEYADPEKINGLNLYAYCGNNPVMNVDPTGEFLLSFLLAVLVGAVIGGVAGANGWYNAKALEYTHNPNSNEVVLGRSGVYEKIAEERGATYFKMPEADWAKLSKHSRTVWKINKAFLKQQIVAGKTFIMASNPTNAGGYYFMKEVTYLLVKGLKWIF